jgi:preprotein translocase subunit SecG
MIILLFVIHVAIAVALVGVILLQKSEGGALGMGGGGMSGFMTGRSTANLLTRTTAYLALAFFVTSVTLVYLNSHTGGSVAHSLIDQGPASTPTTQETPSVPPPAPETPPQPSAPVAK